MKNNTLLLTALSAAAIATGSATAGELTGSLSLDYNSHFTLYGQDVWGAGSNLTTQATLNPALSLNYQVNDALSFQTGFWLDVNDNAGSDFETQETDIWLGVSYTSGIATYSATYQTWQYGTNLEGSNADSEEVLDLAVSFDTFLSPSLTYHKRLDGSGNQSLGSILVLSASHSFDISEKFSVTIPVSIAAVTDKLNGSDSGYAYTSAGLQGSYALNDSTSLNAGITYFTTDGDVAGNVDEDFHTINAGVSYSF